MKMLLRFLPAATFFLLLAGCYEVPVTGRSAMNLVDDKEVSKMSMAAFDDLKSHNPLSRDKERIAQLNRVGERLSRVVFWDMPGAEWEFVVFEVPQQINAFAMAGGKVGVFSGLYKIVNTDDELASVLAHEIAHVTAKHVHERLSRVLAMDTVGTVGTVGAGLTGGLTGLIGGELLSAYGLGSGPSPAFDREKEKEADYIGLIYMAKAGYDPQAAIKVLERLEEVSEGPSNAPNLNSTHPSNPERIQALTRELPKASKVLEESSITAKPIIVK